MSVRDMYTQRVEIVPNGISLRSAAQRMRDADVRVLVVMQQGRPSGVVTDRDIVLRAMASGVGPDEPVTTALSPPPDTIHELASEEDAIAALRASFHRRVLVLDDDGAPVGLLRSEDVMRRVAYLLSAEDGSSFDGTSQLAGP
jgi:CBS domain-containing protein